MSEKIYNSRDNRIDLLLRDDSSGSLTPADLSGTNRVQVIVGSVTLDSDTNPDYFDLSDMVDGKLYLILGAASLTPGNFTAFVITYNLANTNGIVWGTFELVVSNRAS